MSIEAMKQALEALKMCRGLIRNNIAEGVAISSPNPFFSADVDNAITTLRTAIHATELREQAEQQGQGEPVAWMSPSGNLYRTRYHAVANGEQAVTPLYTTPPYVATPLAAQPAPVQEPVKPYAYEYGRDNGDGTYSVVIDKGSLVQTQPAVYNYVRPQNAHKNWPIKELFDRPPAAQRQWVGLTDEEVEELFQGAAGADEEVVHRFARAIEAKLREKNTGETR